MQAMAIMRIGGLLTILGLSIGLMPYWFLRRYSRKQEASEALLAEGDGNAESRNV
jgi:hypothetical protein